MDHQNKEGEIKMEEKKGITILLHSGDLDKAIEITFLLINPRIVSMTYGQAEVTKEDISLLKSLRQKSWNAFQKIGK